MVTLYSRITKLGWFDSEKSEFIFRNVMDDVNKFLSGRFHTTKIPIVSHKKSTNLMGMGPFHLKKEGTKFHHVIS